MNETADKQPPEQVRRTLPEILRELDACEGRFPRTAILEAVEQREAITPALLAVLEQVAADPAAFAERREGMLDFFALYLLAQFREKRAYPLLARILAAPGEVPEKIAGDIITEDLHRIFASTYDGDPRPLERLVEGDAVDEYVRSAAIRTFLVLEATGQMSREAVVHVLPQPVRGKDEA